MGSSTDVESFGKDEATRTIIDLDQLGEKEGYLLDSSLAQGGLKTTDDGRTVLIPQPSEDANDPLNWSKTKKHVILFIIAATSLIPDYGSATGAVTLLPQAAYGLDPFSTIISRRADFVTCRIWKMTEDEVNHSQVGNVFMLGAGGMFVVMFSAYFGRYPVLFWFMIVALATAIWCTAAMSFNSFMAARILNGFFSPVAEAVSPTFMRAVT